MSDFGMGMGLVSEEDVPWATVFDGIDMRLLRVGRADARWSVIFRFSPGITLPKHHHTGSVHALTLSGSWRYLEYEWVARAGSYVHEAPGTVHTLAVPETESEATVVFFVVEGALVLIGDDDAPAGLWDGPAMEELYRGALEEAGAAPALGVLP